MDKLLKQIQSSKIELRSTDQLIPYARNARKHEPWQVAQIAASIKEFGFTNPVLIDASGEIVAGHCRVMSALKLDLPEVPCIVLGHLTPTQRRAYVLADNQLALNSSWDAGILSTELEELKIDGFDLDLLGFGEDLDSLLTGPIETTDGLTDPDDVPEVEKPIVTKGEVWVLGNHRLMCGDSTVVTDVERLMGGETADITFTSPPYNASNAGFRKKKNLYNSYQDDISEDSYNGLISESLSNAILNSQFSFFNLQMLSGNKIAIVEWLGRFKDNLADILVWDKLSSEPAMEPKVCNSQFELIFVFSAKNGATRKIGTRDFRGTVSNVLSAPKQTKNDYAKIHGATFPVHFPEHFISNFVADGGSVIDLFCGTGTTIIACEKTGRRCFGMELDPHYCTVILKRWSQFTGKEPARLEEDGSLTPMGVLLSACL